MLNLLDVFGHLGKISANLTGDRVHYVGNCCIAEHIMSDEMTLEERKVIYRARRGLKEIDVYFDPYVKNHYLTSDQAEKALFAELVEQEDPDLLDWFMEVGEPPRNELKDFILKLKHYVHG